MLRNVFQMLNDSETPVLNEVLSLNAQEFASIAVTVPNVTSSMKS